MAADLIVRGGALAGAPDPCDVIVDRGTIVAVTAAGDGGAGRRIIDAHGLAVLPGAIDAHVHFDDPGRADWEGWATGSLAAAAGGVTTVVDMPIDSDPPTVDRAAVAAKRAAAEGTSVVDFALWGGLVPSNARDVHDLLRSGVVGLKAFLCDSGWAEFPACDAHALALGMQAAAAFDLPVAVHCEDAAHFGAGAFDRPVGSEVAAVATAGATAAKTEAALHVVHCSSAAAVDEAGRWPRTTVETCPHYLAMNADEVSAVGPDAQCCPPVRDEANRLALLERTRNGAVHSVASDHSPCPPQAKDCDPPFAGVSGVETALSVLLSLDVLPLPELVRLRTAAAALCRLPRKGAVTPDYDADLVLLDLHATWRVTPETLHTRHRRSPFTGRTLPGVVVTTLVRGSVVYESGSLAAPPTGAFLAPTTADPQRAP